MRPVFDVFEKIVKCKRFFFAPLPCRGMGQKKNPRWSDPPGICAANCRRPDIGAKRAGGGRLGVILKF